MMSSNRPSADNLPTGKRRSSFRKSEFVIRSKEDDSFSQIDSFKVTAKKPAEAPESQQPRHYAMPGYSGNPSMPGHMPQTFQPTQYSAQGQSVWIQGQHPNSTLSMHGNLFLSQVQAQGQMSSQMPPGHTNVLYNQVEANRFTNTLPGQSHALANQMPQVLANQMPHGMGNQMLDFSSNQSQSILSSHHQQVQRPQQQTSASNKPSTQPQTNANDDFSDFSQFSSAPTNVPTTQYWGSGEKSMSTSATPFASNHALFPSDAPAPTSFVSNSAAMPGAFAPAQFVPGAFTPTTYAPNASMTPASVPPSAVPELTDDFQGFASFEAPSSRKNDFTEFSSFSEAETKSCTGIGSLATTTTVSSVTQSSAAAPAGPNTTQEDEFGDFGSFAQPPPSEQTPAPAVKPLPQSFDGKRMNIIVKKNLGAMSAGATHKEQKVTPAFNQTSITKDTTCASQPAKKAGSLPNPGLDNLANTLAQAKSQLSAPVPPPAEEQKDFNILQQVISAKSSIPPVVQETDAAFTLPDTPTQLAQIFPKCTPKRASQPDAAEDNFQGFAAFFASSEMPSHSDNQQTKSTNESFGTFSAFSTSENQSNATVTAGEANSNDDSFSGFAAFTNTDIQLKPSTSQEGQNLSRSSNEESFGGFAAFTNPDIQVKPSTSQEGQTLSGASNDESFGGFAAFTNPDTQVKPSTSQEEQTLSGASNEESFGGFAAVTNPDIQVKPSTSQEGQTLSSASNDESFGGFAAFTSAPPNMQHESTGDFGNFSVANPKTEGEHEGSSQAAIERVKEIKSHAVDWSAFSALDELRAEEEEGNLGDFSVFGSTLREVSGAEQPQQPNFLLSPEEAPTGVGNLSDPQSNADFSKKALDKEEDNDDWAAFAEPASEDATFPVATSLDGDWAAFSQAPEQAEPPYSSTGLFVTPLSKPGPDTGLSDAEPPQSHTSSKPPFEIKPVNDIIDDNDSDWSGFAGPAHIQPDNISSDWSFKDNASVQEDGKSVSSGGPAVNSKADLSEPLKTHSDWSTEIPPLTEIQSPEDEWTAFGAIDRSNKHSNSDSETRSRSSTIKDQTGDFKGQNFEADFTFSSSPPPFSPATPTSSFADVYSSQQLHSAENVLEGSVHQGAEAMSNGSASKADLTGEDNSMASMPKNDETEWGDFGENSRDLSKSPDLFSPPPLTEGDFSPHKQAVKASSDWFSFSSSQESPWPASDIVKVELSDQGGPSELSEQTSEYGEKKELSADDSVSLTDQTLCESKEEDSFHEHLSKDFSTPSQVKMPHASFNNSEGTQSPSSLEFTSISIKPGVQKSDDGYSFGEPPSKMESQNSGNVTSVSDQPLTSVSISANAQDDDDFIFNEPPPFTDDTPGEEIPPFGMPQQFHIEDDDFSAFSVPNFEEDSVRQTAGAAVHNDGTNDLVSGSSATDDSTLAVAQSVENWGFHSSKPTIDSDEPETVTDGEPKFSRKGSNSKEVDWAFPSDLKTSQGPDHTSWKQSEELSAHGADDWAFGSNNPELGTSPEPKQDSRETSSIASKEADSDWAFQATSNGTDDDDDQWSFKSPDIRSTSPSSPALSPPVVSPSSSSSAISVQSAISPQSTSTSQRSATNSPALGNPPAPSANSDDVDFGEFADDDFQAFDSSSAPADPGPLSDSSSLSVTKDKIIVLLNSAFKCPSPLQPVTSNKSKLTDSLTSSGLWRSLTDLNQSVSLKLEWRESRCHVDLLSSLSVNGTSSSYQVSSSKGAGNSQDLLSLSSAQGSTKPSSSSIGNMSTGFTDLL